MSPAEPSTPPPTVTVGHTIEPADARVARLVAEGLIAMREAAKLYGVGTHKATPTRHATRGIRMPDGSRLYLESVRAGGQLKTSREAVLRFLTAQQARPVPIPVAPETVRSRRARAARAEAELDALGVTG